MTPYDLQQQFPQDAHIYLNHAAVAPWPKATGDAVAAFARENVRQGAADYPSWVATERELKARLQTLINAPHSDDIALLKNTSEAISVVAWGFPWRAGDNLVICRQEFPSNRIPWESLKELGVEVRTVDLATYLDPEAAICELCDRNTRLIAVSSVQYADGFRMDLEQLGRFAQSHDIAFCVDAIQSLGALPFDCQAIGADFVMADGHKWLLGPEGVAMFYCRAEWRERLKLYQFGWHMTEEYTDFDAPSWRVAKSARRFESGSANMLGIHALHASLGLLQAIGPTRIRDEVLDHTQLMIEAIEATKTLKLVSNPAPERRSGIVTFRRNNMDGRLLHRKLLEQGVIAAHRGGGIRFSPHFYTSAEKLGYALKLAEQIT